MQNVSMKQHYCHLIWSIVVKKCQYIYKILTNIYDGRFLKIFNCFQSLTIFAKYVKCVSEVLCIILDLKKSSIGVKLYFQSAFWEIPFLSEEANISDRR